MDNQNTKKVKEEEESSTLDNPSVQGQLSEEEEEKVKRMNKTMQKVFAIPLVVEDVLFDKLRLDDLNSCRLVSSKWKEMATKVILKKDCSKVSIIYDKKRGKYRNPSPQQVQEKLHLTELTEIMKKSNPFPSSTFIINEGNLGDPELLDFFKADGNGIKTLYLLSKVATSLDILVHCPNVETLGLYLPRNENTSMVQIELLNLKVLSAGLNSGFRFRNIIAPNLQVLERFALAEDTTDVVKAGKIHTVKGLILNNIPEHTSPEKLQELVNAGPQIETLVFCDFEQSLDENWIRGFAGPLQQLLDTCKDTLKVFEFNGLGQLFQNVKFPRFSLLRELRICDFMENKRRFFPIRINLPKTFPELEVLDVYYANLKQHADWDEYLPPPDAYRGQLTSVKEIKIRENCTQKCREMLQLMCPNARILIG